MKTKLYLIASIIMSIKIFAQSNLKGFIKDENNQTLPGVVVYIPSVNKSTISNKDGYFEINRLPKGYYVVEFKLLGYKTISKKVNINESDIELNIQMQPSAREIDEITVTTAADVIQDKDNPINIKSISFDILNQQASNNIIEAISKKDNVWALTTGQGIAKPIIRGLGYNRSLVLVNGLRQEGQQWGDEHGVEIDQYAISKAEVIKGPSSIMFGSDALAGVINFIPYRISNDGWSGKYLGLYQTNNQMIANSALVQFKKNDLGFFVQGTQKDASYYQNTIDGKVFNSGFNERNLSVAFQINKSWGMSNFYGSIFTQQLNMPTGDRDSLGRFLVYTKETDSTIIQVPVSDEDLKGYKFFYPYQYIQHYRVQNYSVFNLKNNSKIISNIGYQYNIRDEYGIHSILGHHHEEHGHSHDHEDEKKHGELSMHLHSIPYQLKYVKNIDSTQLFSIGSSGMYQKNINKGEELLIPDYSLMDLGFYMFYQKTFRHWTFAGGLRWDNRSISTEKMLVDSTDARIEGFADPNNSFEKFSAISKNYHNFSGTAGLVFNGWKDITMKFNISRGFRAPNLSELMSNGGHEGTVRYEYGNIALKPEVSHQLDAGLIVNKEHFLFEFTPFVNHISNYIYFRKLSSVLGGDSIITRDGENVWAFTYDQANALIYGGELNIDIHPHPLDWLHFETNFSYLQGSMLNQPDSTRYLPFFPPNRWTNELRTEWKNINSFVKLLFVKAEAMYVFPQNRFFKAYNTETFTPDYTLVNLSAGVSIKYWCERELQFIVGVNNLFDKTYQDHLNRLKYVRPNPATGRMGLFNMGRNIFLRLIVNF